MMLLIIFIIIIADKQTLYLPKVPAMLHFLPYRKQIHLQ